VSLRRLRARRSCLGVIGMADKVGRIFRYYKIGSTFLAG
jgi:hypothetical protein